MGSLRRSGQIGEMDEELGARKTKVLYIERKAQGLFSIERVFRLVARSLSPERFESSFQQVPHATGLSAMVKNLLQFVPEEADVLHVTGDIGYIALKLPTEKTVLTIHDLSVLNYRTGVRRWLLKKILFEWPVRRLKYLTVISQATYDDLLRHTRVDPAKVRIIENPLDDALSTDAKPPFNSDRPNILQVGTLPYKNVPNLIRALRGLDCNLTIVGKLDTEVRRLLEENDIWFDNEESLDDAGMKEAYRRADIVTFCSVFEGFGMPIIEAQAMQTPVVTSNIEPMKSVAGDGAIFVDPRNPDEIRNAIESIIGNSEARDRLVRAGSRNVARFAPSAIAEKYSKLYAEVIAS